MFCNICGSENLFFFATAKDIEYCTSEKEFSFYECLDCNTLKIEPMLSSNLDEIYPNNYYSFSSKKKSLAIKAKEFLDQKYFSKLTSRIKGTSINVLDVGGGTGWLLDLLKKSDKRVSGTTVVDIDSSAQALALENGHKFFLGRIEEFNTDQLFDVILMLNLIEHVSSPTEVLQNAKELLNSDGIIVIKTPNYISLDAKIFKNKSWAGFHTPRHFNIFSRKSIELAALKAGLQIESFNYTQGAPFWSISVLYLLRRLGLISITAERPAIYHPLVPLLQILGAAFDFARKPFSKLSQMEIVLKRAD